jgi:hypothetical protein
MGQPLPRTNPAFARDDARQWTARCGLAAAPRPPSRSVGRQGACPGPDARAGADPRADEAAQWIAGRARRELDRPEALAPLIDELLARVIADRRADVETSRTPGDFSVRPVMTERPHNLADYARFDDILHLPTGAMDLSTEEPEIELFGALAAANALVVVNSALAVAARLGLAEAPAPLRAYLHNLDREDALEAFAHAARYELAVSEQFDEYDLVNELGALPFPSTLLARRPDQTARLAADQALAAASESGERAYKLKSPGVIDAMLRGFSFRARGLPLSDMALLAEILRRALNMDMDASVEDSDFDVIDFSTRLAKDRRLVALLPRRQQPGFLQTAGEWRRRAGANYGGLDQPLARLYQRLDASHDDAGGGRWSIRILQEKRASTFDDSNWPFLLAYALSLGDLRLELDFKIVITRLETIEGKKGRRLLETSAGLLIRHFDVTYLDAAESEQQIGSQIRSHNSKALRRFADARDLIGDIG